MRHNLYSFLVDIIFLNYVFIKKACIMLKIQELKPGDVIRIVDQNTEIEGIVVDVSRDEGMVNVDNGVQEFWYNLDQIAPIPLTEKELLKLGFERLETEDGVKYMKGPFRVLVHDP